MGRGLAGKEASHPARLCPPFSFPLQKTGLGGGTGSETLAPWLIHLIFTACRGPGPGGESLSWEGEAIVGKSANQARAWSS